MPLRFKPVPGRAVSGDVVAFFGALCLFFSTLEYLFPRPLPFFRLGLANLPLVLALYLFPFRQLVVLVLLKSLGQGLLHGTLASYVFLFSLAGSFASLLGMFALRRVPGVSRIGVSIIGALLSNTVQAGLAVLFVFGSNARLILPWFFLLGLISGTLIGIFANWFSSASGWYRALQQGHAYPDLAAASVSGQQDSARRRRPDRLKDLIPAKPRFFVGLFLLIPLFYQQNLILMALQVLFLSILVGLAGKRVSWLYFLNFSFFIVLFQLLTPYGRLLADFGFLRITSGALQAGLQRAFLLTGLVFTSLFSVSKDLVFPGSTGRSAAKMLYYFERLYQSRHMVRRQSFIADVDQILIRASQGFSVDRSSAESPVTLSSATRRYWIFAALLFILFYSLLIAGLII